MPITSLKKDSNRPNYPRKIKKMSSTTIGESPSVHIEKDANTKLFLPTTCENNDASTAATIAGSVSHESTSSGECLPLSRSAGSTEQLPALSEAEQQQKQQTTKGPTLDLALPQLKAATDVGSPAHMIICREWKTEAPSESAPILASTIPEKDAVLWLIRDFSAFRSAAKVSQIPPLMSPEFGGGCRLRLWLYEKKGHIIGSIELPIVKASRDGVAHFRISVVRTDLKRMKQQQNKDRSTCIYSGIIAITKRKVEMRVSAGGSDKKFILQHRCSPTFKLTRARCLRSPKYERLVFGDCLRVRVEFEYFPFDASVFRGFGRSSALSSADSGKADGNSIENARRMTPSELLNDIRQYCQDDGSQNVEIRRDEIVFNACRFLLCARSKRFREIFGTNVSTSRGSPSRLGPFARTATPGSSLSSITIQDVPAETLDQILSFIHTDTCPWIDDRSTDVLKVLDLLEGADLYGIESLTNLLIIYLADRMDNENFMFMYDIAERINNPELKRLCTQFMDSLPGSQVASLMRANSCVPSPRAT